MDTVLLQARSSSGGYYDVTFTRTDSSLAVSCTCQAGLYGWLCKHKTQLLDGNEAMLYNSKQASLLRQVKEWIAQSEYEALVAEYKSFKKGVEEAMAVAKAQEQALKHKVERILHEGIPLKEIAK